MIISTFNEMERAAVKELPESRYQATIEPDVATNRMIVNILEDGTISLYGEQFDVDGFRRRLRNYKGTLQQVQQEHEEAQFSLSQAALWRSEIVQARSSHDALSEYIDARGGNFNLLTFVNNTLSEHGLIERADFSNARPGVGGVPAGDFEGVQLHLSGVSMEELIDFLHTLYDSGNLIVLSDLRYLRPADDGQGLDTEMTFFCPQG